MTTAKMLVATLLGWTLTQAPSPASKATFLDLQGYANQKLKAGFHTSGSDANNLAALPVGKQELDGIIFEIGESVVQLGCTQLKDKPEMVEGISVNRSCDQLHILHAAAFKTEENTVIGTYLIHYADSVKKSIEIVYGQDVQDWWFEEQEKAPARSRVAWIGDNDEAKGGSKRIRLYHTIWKNPHPEKKIASIDFMVAEGSSCAPFCVAMTIE
jgi:hypothetical protein